MRILALRHYRDTVNTLDHAEHDTDEWKRASESTAAYVHMLAIAEERGQIDRAEAKRRYEKHLNDRRERGQ
jgi:hypothetical protein